MLGPLGGPELAIILVIVLLIFGVGRISGIGRELGSSIKEFRRAVKSDDDENAEAAQNVQQAQVAPPVQQPQAPAAPAPQEQPQSTNSDATNKEPQKNIF